MTPGMEDAQFAKAVREFTAALQDSVAAMREFTAALQAYRRPRRIRVRRRRLTFAPMAELAALGIDTGPIVHDPRLQDYTDKPSPTPSFQHMIDYFDGPDYSEDPI